MFSPRKVQEEVKQRLAVLRNVDEDTIHQVYLAVMFENLHEARIAVGRARVEAEQRRAYHPEKGWIMVSREQQDQLMKLLSSCEDILRPM